MLQRCSNTNTPHSTDYGIYSVSIYYTLSGSELIFLIKSRANFASSLKDSFTEVTTNYYLSNMVFKLQIGPFLVISYRDGAI